MNCFKKFSLNLKGNHELFNNLWGIRGLSMGKFLISYGCLEKRTMPWGKFTNS